MTPLISTLPQLPYVGDASMNVTPCVSAVVERRIETRSSTDSPSALRLYARALHPPVNNNYGVGLQSTLMIR